MLLDILEKKELSGVSLRVQGRVRKMDPTTIISRLTEKAKEAIVERFHDLKEYQFTEKANLKIWSATLNGN